MIVAKRFRSWLLATLHRQALERRMDDELRFHMETHVEHLMRGGMERGEAELQARLEFGSFEPTKEACREAFGADLVHSLLSDIRCGAPCLLSG